MTALTKFRKIFLVKFFNLYLIFKVKLKSAVLLRNDWKNGGTPGGQHYSTYVVLWRQAFRITGRVRREFLNCVHRKKP